MIEAVGWQYYDDLLPRAARDLLAPDGLMLLQAITIDDRAFEVEKAGRSFANELIFPGGCLPSLEVIRRSLRARHRPAPARASRTSPAHYPETLRRWRLRAGRRRPTRPPRLGYDEPFRRLFELLLRLVARAASSSAASRTCQMLLAGPAYRGSRVNMRPAIASMSAAGPREASLASASRPPGPST